MTSIRYEKGVKGDPFGSKVAVSDEHPGLRGVGQTVGDAREALRKLIATKTGKAVSFDEEPGSIHAEHADRMRREGKP